MIRGVLFDVDFTLIQPGPVFRGEGYQAFCARYGMNVDAGRFEAAVQSAASLLEAPEDAPYDAEIFVAYARHVIERMGGSGPGVELCAREIYDQWAACRHFELYEDVPEVLRELTARGLRIGLISNSHRSLASFQSHFELEGLIWAALSSPEHGFMKPSTSIFTAALQLLDVPAAESLMVGDSIREDVEGALRAGMRAVLMCRAAWPHPKRDELAARGVLVVSSLRELPRLLD